MEIKKEKIFITGISSEMMLKLVSQIDSEKYEIAGLTRNPEKIAIENVRLVKGDLADVDHLKPYLRDCSILIHAASVTHSFRRNEYCDVNFTGTRKLVDLAKSLEVKRFIFISSNTAGIKNGAYAKSKYLAEKYIVKNFDRWSIYRPAEVFGTKKNEGIDKLIENIATKRVQFCPMGVPNKFYPIHIDDLVRFLFASIFIENPRNEIISIYGRKGYSFKEVITIGKRHKKKGTIILPVPRGILLFFEKLIRLHPFQTYIARDQITRLYRPKQEFPAEHMYGEINFGSYVEDKIKNSSTSRSRD